jgi:hypothetical protein
MLTPSEKEKLISDLKKCETMAQVQDYLTKNFDLQNCTLGMVSKPLIIEGTIKMINLLNAKKK